MAISIYNIKKWYNMMCGKSILHVNQDIGKCFSKTELLGYYNNLTEKVTKQSNLVDTQELPTILQEDGVIIVFPVAVFQYALGCYDLYLLKKDDRYLNKFLQLAAWTFQNQDQKGRWDNFSHTYPQHPYGAMAQGEAVSVLLRAYKKTNDEKFLEASHKAINYMLQPIEKNGTTLYDGQDVLLKEFQHLPLVMNGWIFAWWGLYDYVLVTHDSGEYLSILEKSCSSLIKFLPKFDTYIWSKYDADKKLASPFYHHLHIAQMQAMYILTGNEVFKRYADKWKEKEKNVFCKTTAFLLKAVQKIME
ncbi:D-glucuronyl C5-epimerase [Bacteroidales bacterium KA00344]|nr:D-glucuronyl C5-epimerase [Bacteroidales bacterium KA00344]